MSFNVERHLRLLDVIKNSNPKLRNAIIACAEPELINAISEICYNFLRGNIICTKKQFDVLKKHKNCIRKLAKCGAGENTITRRKILLQKGSGFWISLLTPVISELTAYFMSRALKK